MNFKKQMMGMVQNSFDNMFNIPKDKRFPVPGFDPQKNERDVKKNG